MIPSDSSSPELSPIKRALLEIRDLRAQIDALNQANNEPIAITGVGLHFPGDVNNLNDLWEMLRNGVDTVVEIPPERWDLDQYYDEDPAAPGKMTTRFGTFVKDIDRFDAAFFGISPREAISMDPQQRLLLETTWEALENAAISPEKLAGTQTGVFVGISNSDYFRMIVRDPERIDTYASTGGTLSVASGRIAYLLGLHGPAISVDTACSSSLVALHLACQSLRQKECNLALVGGVNLTLTPEANINFSKATGMMAQDGRCKTFDDQADGYVRGEGCAMIVVKRLADAQADGDTILAIIRGSAINQDGRSSGLTAPNGPSQEAVIRSALQSAGVEPRQVGYVEAHGTGTSLGDPIEVHALGAVYGQKRDPSHPLYIGSIKTNVGHLEAAAGIAGLLKVVVALQHAEIPPNLHFKTPNKHIVWEDFPLTVPVSIIPWQPVDGKRIAGISSFGFSGTNSHVILEEAPPIKESTTESPAEDRLHLLPFSAKSEPALRALAGRYSHYLEEHPLSAADFSRMAHTLGVGRAHYVQRLAVRSSSSDDLREQLIGFQEGKNASTWWTGRQVGSDQPPVVFLFTGHGSQYVNMGRELYENEPVFREIIDRCTTLLRDRLPQPLSAVLYPAAEDGELAAEMLNDMTYGQPAMFALEYGLACLWRSWGIEPAAVAGHSLGEYAAAAVAGVLSMEDALTLIAERGRLMQQLPEDGLMVTAFTDEARITPLIKPYAAEVSIAAINSPETIVISGRRSAVEKVVEGLTAQSIRTRILNISRAAHSPMVEPMIPEIGRTIAKMHFFSPEIEFFSTVTGEAANQELTRPEYWQRHLRQTVRYADAVQSLYNAGYRTFLEIGPHPTLINLGQRTLPDDEQLVWLASLREGTAEREQILESMGRLYVNGAEINWHALQGPVAGSRLPLPTYPWEHKSYWWESGSTVRQIQAAPIWETAIAAGKRQSQQAPIDLEISTFDRKWEALNRLTSAYIRSTLVQLGAFTQAGERCSAEMLLEKYAVLPTYRSLMLRWLDQMTVEGWLQRTTDGTYVAVKPITAPDMAAPMAEVQAALQDAPFLVEYINDCGEHLKAVITGKESPLEMMFPGGSMQRAEDLYQNWAHARYFNQIVAALVESVAQADPSRTLRILEIGAGTGATAAAVLPLLPLDRTIYHFTDVSDLFLDRARLKFAAFPFVRYGLLDAEKDGLSQGYGRGQFDIVIAANVIHATHSLSETLSNTRELLAPDGVLILFEATTHKPWFDITTGLIEGWQNFGDDLRATSPLLSAEMWDTLLRREDFADVAIFPPVGSAAAILGESVIAARPIPQEASSQAGLHLPEAETSIEKPSGVTAAPDRNMLEKLKEQLPDERRETLLEFVRGHVVAVLRLDADSLPDRKARLMDLGVDSLMAVELRGRLGLGLKLDRKLPATLIFDYPTIEAITDYLLRDVLVFETPTAESTPSLQPTSATDLESLSDDDVEAMLLAKLKEIK